MFVVYFVNHDYYAQDVFPSLQEAINYGIDTGFEFTVHRQVPRSVDGVVTPHYLIAGWSPIGGLKRYD